MKRRLPDWAWALVAAITLLVCAALILFVAHPGGFEGQVGWLFALMPGAIVGLPLADRMYRIAPSSERFVLWGTIISVSLVWYFAVSYSAIAAYRFIVRRPLA
jgi:uncharacterized membrane protein